MKNKRKLELIKNMIEDQLDIQDISSKSRRQDLTYGRFMYFKIAREHTKNSLENIAAFVNRDHSTACYGIQKFNELIEYNKECEHLKKTYDDVNEFLNGNNVFDNENDLLDLNNITTRLDNIEQVLQNLIYENRSNTVCKDKVTVGNT